MKLKLRHCDNCKHATLQAFTESYYQFSGGELSSIATKIWYCPNCGGTSRHNDPRLQKAFGNEVIKLDGKDC